MATVQAGSGPRVLKRAGESYPATSLLERAGVAVYDTGELEKQKILERFKVILRVELPQKKMLSLKRILKEAEKALERIKTSTRR